MLVLVVGGGGREHAIIKKLKENPAVEHIVALPGNAGIAGIAECVPIGTMDFAALTAFSCVLSMPLGFLALQRY